MSKKYFPNRGDAVWLNFSPKAGHEQSGRRPAVVVSPGSYNKKVGLGLFCPITSRNKGYPFEVGIPAGTNITFEVRASDTSFTKDDSVIPWLSVGGTSPVTSGLPSGRYKQWRAILTPNGTHTDTPVLQEVRAYLQQN